MGEAGNESVNSNFLYTNDIIYFIIEKDELPKK